MNKNVNFVQPPDGFGLSNFRKPVSIAPPIQNGGGTMDPAFPQPRATTDFQLENAHQFSNPISQYETSRHSNFLFSQHYKDYNIIDQENVDGNYVYWDLIKNYQERNPLIDFFFSKKNIDHLQALTIKMVALQSDGAYKISRQNDNELLAVMRSIYISTSTNPLAVGDEFKKAVCTLNKNVLDWVVPRIIVNAQQYLGYVRDQSNNIRPIDRAEFMSNTGNKVNRGFDAQFI